MKNIYIAVLLSLTFTACGGTSFRDRIKERIVKKLESQPAPETSSNTNEKLLKEGPYLFSFEDMGKKRMYKIYLPKSFDSSKAYPLLLAFHGGGGDMEYMSRDELYKILSKADQRGFVVVFPSGYSRFQSGKLATWNAGNCCGDARDLEIDDIHFVKEVLSRVYQQVNIDKKKIYATGMSNGGMMSYRLACEMSDTFKAIAAVAGTDNTKECHPKNPISILHIHAKDDDHVLFNGGVGQAFSEERMKKITNFISVPETIKKWREFNKCSSVISKSEFKGAYCEEYTQCSSQIKVKLCATDEGGHSWPGGNKPRGNSKPSTAISANDMMWDFFDSIK